MQKRFLVVAPHPDDAELGLGGTIIKLKKQGHKVFIVDLTSGEPTPYGTEKKRQKETRKANKILKVDDRLNLALENRYLFDDKEARLLLAEHIRMFKPDIVFGPHPKDAHPDHVAASQITAGARFYAKFTKAGLKGIPHYPRHLLSYFCSHLKTPPPISFLIDISQTFKEKVKALRCYESQFTANPQNRFIFKYIENQNKYLGSLIGAQYAEAIVAEEMVGISDLSTLL